MQVLKISTNAGLPVQIADVLLDLRIDSTDQQPTIERLVKGACDFLEKKSGFAIRQGTYHAVLCSWWCGPLEILRAPLRELLAIQYLSANDTWTDVSLDDFQISRRKKSFVVAPLPAFDAPDLFSDLDSVRLVFTAGFDEADESETDDLSFPLEDDLSTTLIALVAEAYKNTEISELNMGQVEDRWNALLKSNRQFW